MNINFLNNIISSMGTSLIVFYIFEKSINYKILFTKKLFLILWCFLWALFHIANTYVILSLLIRILFCIASIIVTWKIIEIELDTAISAFLLSFGISNSLYFIAAIPIGLILAPFLIFEYPNQELVDFNSPIYLLPYTLIAFLQFIMACQLFKIRRFRNGFPFLFKKYAVIIALIVTGIVMLIASIFSSPRERYDNIYIFSTLFSGIIVTGIGIIIWIRQGIKMFYIKKMKERTIEQLEQELLNVKAENQKLIEQNDILRAASHKINARIKALERTVKNFNNTEISEELAVTFEDIKRLKHDYENDVSKIKKANPLPSTKIKGLDNMFRYFSQEYRDNNIHFNLKVNGSIPYLVENIIEQSKLETMIGDHLQDALIAVNASDNTFRSVLAIIGLSEDCYEFTVFDSGIPFEADTLMRLGTERVTTHADTSGSGIGFMTTFETMRECEASLIINEKEPSKYDYTKSVTVRFDGENQYIIETYRSEDIIKNDEKYMVVSIR